MTEIQSSASPGFIRATLKSETEALVAAEPLLANLACQIMAGDSTLVDIVVRSLARVLQQPEVPQQELLHLLSTVSATMPHMETSIAHDLHAVRLRDPACLSYLHAIMNFKGFKALQAYRIANALWAAGRPQVAAWLSNRVSLILGPDIHPAARLGKGIMLDHGSGIVIGETAVVDDYVSILQNVTLGGTGKVTGDRHPKIRRGVMIGAGAKIIGNIEVGEFSKVAAGSVVLKAVPPRCTVAGIPAQIVRLHGPDEIPALSMNQDI